MNIITANKIVEDGLAAELYKSGFLPAKFFTYYDIYLWVDMQIKVRRITKRTAVHEAEIKFDVQEMTIWRALKSFSVK